MTDELKRETERICKKSTPHLELINELMDPCIPKKEREHVAAREIDDLRSHVAKLQTALDKAQKDTQRLQHLAYEPFCDIYGDVDLHEEAFISASEHGRDEPNKEDYLFAVRVAIDAVMGRN